MSFLDAISAERAERIRHDHEKTSQRLEWLGSPHPPAAGSALAGDDRLYPAWPTSQVALQGLISATDHLSLLFESVQVRTRPIAQFTPARASLFAASCTIWVLSPKLRADRQSRALSLAHEDFRQLRALVTDIEGGSMARLLTPEQASAVRTYVDTQVSTIEQVQGFDGGKPSDTQIIEQAAAYIDSQNEGAAHALKLLWRVNSGHAHGLGWPELLRHPEIVSRSQSDPSIYYRQVKADPDAIAQAIEAATLASDVAFRLYQQRAASPTCD
ncbi:hypothetical protein LTT66_11855 [Nocardia gipuzkoensis]|uniref:hypothetical protein n=1 Tax=Nocardia TaxID=1817 RepID=UPI001E54475A|nr:MULTISPECIES: hypothetical protein [Nocardia]UGT70797.1 hypothetical protein LTT66_11855 [Nocardia gipuzkoensis]